MITRKYHHVQKLHENAQQNRKRMQENACNRMLTIFEKVVSKIVR
jgi:hypothetical protein